MMPPWHFFKLLLWCYTSPTATERILCWEASITETFRKTLSFNTPISAPNGMSTQKWDKMSGFAKASWRDFRGFHHQQNFMDSLFWMVYIWGKQNKISKQTTPPKNPKETEKKKKTTVWAESSCNKAGNTSTVLRTHAWLRLHTQHCTTFH